LFRKLVAVLILSAIAFLPLSGAATTARVNSPAVLSSTPASSAKPYSRKPSKDAEMGGRRTEAMSLDERLAIDLVGINATFLNQDSEAFKALRHQVVDNHVGGIILFRGPVYESVVIVNRMQELAKHPLLISADLEAGSGMRFDDTVNFPWNMAIAATGNPDYARRAGELTGREARAIGFSKSMFPSRT
jgi:beta-N-acetylhexosaminidase